MLLAAVMGLALPALADDTLDRGIGSEWSSLDPHVNFDAAALILQMDAYEGLTTFDKDGKPVPGAAERWEVSEDGKTYTFHLREGLKWSNGDPVTAQQFVDGAIRLLDPVTASPKGYYFYSAMTVKGAQEFSEGTSKDPASVGISAPDDRTVVISMLSPAPHLLDMVGAMQMTPLHGPSYAAHGAGVFVDPAKVVTNGAYMIKEVVPQSHVLLEKNPNYWDAANVKIPFVKYHVTEDVSTELKRYQAGELEVTYDVPLAAIETLQTELPDELKIYPSLQSDFYSLNLTKPPFDNIDLRRAMTLAIDRDVLEGKIVKSGAIPALSYAGGFDPAYQGPAIAEATMSQAEREALAQELYAKAGYGPENPLKISITCSVAEENTRRAQGVALMWKKVLGAEVEVNAMERKAWLDTLYAGTWEVFQDNYIGDYVGPESFLSYMRPSAEPGYNWVSDAYEAAMDEASKIADPDARNVALAKAEKILLDDYIFAPIAITPSRHLVKPTVHGWGTMAASYNISQFLTLD